MHLLLIHQNFPGQFRDLAPAWLRGGHQVTAIGCAAAPQDSQRWEGLLYIQYQLPPSGTPSPDERGQAVAGICQQLPGCSPAPDVVLTHCGWGEARYLRDVFPTTPIIVFPELWGHPEALGFGFDQHLDGQVADLEWFEAQNQLAAEAIELSDAALVACQAQRNSFPPALQNQLTVLPEGLELQAYGRDSTATIQLNDQTFTPGDPLVTLVSRGLEPLRGLRQVLLAWPEIAAAIPQAQLLLVGAEDQGYGVEAPPGQHTHLSSCLATLPAEVDLKRIHILGCLSHAVMLNVLQCSACHIALSYPYTLSWSTLEAMACGAALVSNDGSPIAPELLSHGIKSLVPFNDPHALARTTIEVLRSSDLRNDLGQQVQRIVRERFSLSSSLSRYEALFAALIHSEKGINQSSRAANT